MRFSHFPIAILGQVWYLIVSIPDLCTLTYFTLLLLPAFVNAHRRKMYLNELIFHLSIAFIPFSYINLYPEFFILALSKDQTVCVQRKVFNQHYYEFSDGNQFSYNTLPRNGRDVLLLQGTSSYHRNHIMYEKFWPVQKMFFKYPIFICHIKKFGFKMSRS